MRLIHGAATHVGLVRNQNEDSFLAIPGLYAVCDGMGGARAGEVASELACATLKEMPRDAGADHLRAAVDEANRIIRERSLADSALSGMGTTLTAASGSASVLTIAQVGDSRAYLLRDGSLRQVTEDHSLVAEMIRQGQLTADQAAVHPHRSIITRALGTEPAVTPDIIDLTLEVGDRVLLCSDGLSGMVREDELQGILGAGDDPGSVADELVAAALENGGEDNVTVVVVFAVEDGEAWEDATPVELSVPDPERPDVDGPVPAADVPTQDETLRADSDESSSSARETGERRPSKLRKRLLIAIAAVVLAAVLATAGFFAFNSTVYFVGTTSGQVALFQGMPYRVMGVQLYEAVETVPARFDDLDPYLQERVDSHELVTKEEGLRFIRSLETSQ